MKVANVSQALRKDFDLKEPSFLPPGMAVTPVTSVTSVTSQYFQGIRAFPTVTIVTDVTGTFSLLVWITLDCSGLLGMNGKAETLKAET